MTSFNGNKIDFVTNTIIGTMEAGNIPWIFPYDNNVCIARSYVTKKHYSISNQMYLMVQQGSNEGEFIGAKAVENDKNLSLKENAKPLTIFFALPPMMRERNVDGQKKTEWYGGFTKTHTVYNVKDVNGLAEEFKESDNFEYLDADSVIKKYTEKHNIKINIENVTPHYATKTDDVTIPSKSNFVSETEFYKTIFHELVHSTCIKSRCNRKGIFNLDDTDAYAAEELVAEIGSAYLASLCNLPNYIETIPNAAAYCKGWYEKLKSSPALLLKAANAAEKAIKYILE